MLDRMLSSLPPDAQVVVAGRRQPTARAVRFVQDEPAGGGPVAGIAAALPAVITETVAVVAVDMPWAAGAVAELPDIDQQVDAVVPVDDHEQRQPLCAVYRTDALRRAIHGSGHGQSMKSVLSALTVRTVLVGSPLMDVDTPEQLRQVRAMMAGMDKWIEAVKKELGLEMEVPMHLTLDLAKDVAHGVTRPAAPLTTFLLGAAMASGIDPQVAAARIAAMAKDWSDDEQ